MSASDGYLRKLIAYNELAAIMMAIRVVTTSDGYPLTVLYATTTMIDHVRRARFAIVSKIRRLPVDGVACNDDDDRPCAKSKVCDCK